MPDSVRQCPMCGEDVAAKMATCTSCGEAFSSEPVGWPAHWVRRVIWLQLVCPVYFFATYYGRRGSIPWSRAADEGVPLVFLASFALGLASLICIGNSVLNEKRRSVALFTSFVITMTGWVMAAFCLPRR